MWHSNPVVVGCRIDPAIATPTSRGPIDEIPGIGDSAGRPDAVLWQHLDALQSKLRQAEKDIAAEAQYLIAPRFPWIDVLHFSSLVVVAALGSISSMVSGWPGLTHCPVGED
jgi:hypothetical protein